MGGPSVKLSSGILFRTESRWAELVAGSVYSLLLSKPSALRFCGVCCVCGFVWIFFFLNWEVGTGRVRDQGGFRMQASKQACIQKRGT